MRIRDGATEKAEQLAISARASTELRMWMRYLRCDARTTRSCLKHTLGNLAVRRLQYCNTARCSRPDSICPSWLQTSVDSIRGAAHQRWGVPCWVVLIFETDSRAPSRMCISFHTLNLSY